MMIDKYYDDVDDDDSWITYFLFYSNCVICHRCIPLITIIA